VSGILYTRRSTYSGELLRKRVNRVKQGEMQIGKFGRADLFYISIC
jgi:hypothetical protein